MKKVLSLVLVLAIIVVAVPLGAFEFNVEATTYTHGVWQYEVVDGYAVLTGVTAVQEGSVCGPPSYLGGYPLKVISGINCGALAGIRTTQFIIPQGVETISQSAFNTGLFTSIVMPKTLKNIKFNAFPNCYNFTTIYYEGTESEWSNIYIDYPGLSNEPVVNATKYYNYKYTNPEQMLLDYSEFTANQYLAMIFTDNNYFGSLNQDGEIDNYPPYTLMDEYLLDAEKTSRARLVYNKYRVAYDYMALDALYKLLTFKGSLATDVMKLEDYYTAMIFSVVDNQIKSENFIDNLNCENNKTILSLTQKTADFLESTSKYEIADVNTTLRTTDLDNEDFQSLLKLWALDEDCADLWKLVGEDISIIEDVVSAADTINDAIKSISNFAQLAKVNESTKAVLNQIYLNCPDDNEPLKNAAKKAYECASEKMSYEILTLCEAGYAAFEYALSEIMDWVWEEALTIMLGELAVGVLIGQAIGTAISNFCFATDAVNEQICVLGAMVNFEDVMVNTVKSLRTIYLQDSNDINSSNLLESIYMLNSTYELGCEYVDDFVDLVYTKGAINNVRFDDSEELAEWKQIIASQKDINAQRKKFLFLETYKYFYKIDAPESYEKYFGDTVVEENNSISSITFASSSFNITSKSQLSNQAVVYPLNTTSSQITYYSSDTSIATVDSSGNITPISAGTVTIYATASGITTSCKVTIQEFTTTQNDDTCIITGYMGNDGKIVIPSKINGLSVIGIGDSAFKNEKEITSITIPDSVVILGNSAFENCDGLTSVIIPNSVEFIGEKCFYLCDNLSSITIGNGVKSIGLFSFLLCSKLVDVHINDISAWCEIDFATYGNPLLPAKNLYLNGVLVTDLLIPDDVTSISEGAFWSCSSITSLVIPNSVVSIGDNAFYFCENLENVTISKDTTAIGNTVFSACYKLKDIFVNINNEKYSSVQGVLYDKYKTTLIQYPVGKEKITFSIPNTVADIKKSAFRECKNLTEIIIHNNISNIEDYAFYNCSNLDTVIYCGTQEEWNNITFGSNNEYLLNANIIYLTDLAFSGASVTLQDDLCVNYKVDKAFFEEIGYENPYAVFETGGKEYTVKNYSASGDYYVFKLSNIAPNQINDTISATLYATYNGVEYASETKDYSVSQYCYNMLSKCTDDAYAEFRTLLVDLLNYGAQSQIYTDYNTENLANAALTDTQKAWGTQGTPTLDTVQKLDYETVENPTVKWYGGGLTLEDSVTMRFTIETESVENLSVKVVTADKTYTIKASAFKSIGNNRYYVYFNGLNASQMSEEVYVTVYNGDEAVSNTLRYSIESYAYAKQGGSDTKLSELVIAMMKYGNAAYNYVN